MLAAAIHTLGCKLNQLESEALADEFRKAGFAVLTASYAMHSSYATHSSQAMHGGAGCEGLPVTPADIHIINTCTVTSKADQKARHAIRKALREPGSPCVIVTGCYAQLDSGAIQDLQGEHGGRLFVFRKGDGGSLLELPGYLAGASTARELCALAARWKTIEKSKEAENRFAPERFTFHSRGFLQIQDGCDGRCSYCRARLARGPSRSLEPEQVLEGLRSLEEKGYAEAVLTGMNIALYRGLSMGLGRLLEYLIEKTEKIAIRLSSLDPGCVDENLIRAVSNRRVRPHFHLSVQSGSKAILGSMGRAYDPDAVLRAASLLRSAKDDPFLACDIIAGFPGETEALFGETLSLCRDIGFAWIHAFPYSKRPGTSAYGFSGEVPQKDAARRVQILNGLARDGKAEYAARWLGREVDVLAEGKSAGKGACRGTAENYLKIHVLCRDRAEPGKIIRCRLLEAPGPKGADAVALELS